MAIELKRNIPPKVERLLWVRAAGRCQFDGCNKVLFKSPITQEGVNISEKAHIYSFSEKGPRGWGPFTIKPKALNNIENLMLMCHGCHKTIDQDKQGIKYTADLLRSWKFEHEKRIFTVTGIAPSKKTHVVFYGANIGEQHSPIVKDDAQFALFPERYPVSDNPIILSMICSHEDKTKEFWASEETHLIKVFTQQIEPRIVENSPSHFSVFALAPIPLLIKLGSLFTDKITVNVHQLIRKPKTWAWQDPPENFKFNILKPTTFTSPPSLIMSLSAKIDRQRIKNVLGENCAIWEITLDEEFRNNDFMRSQSQLDDFYKTIRNLIDEVKEKHGMAPLSIFPAIPVSCALELGRIRMPKSDMPWIIYDENIKAGKFIHALNIGETNEQQSKK